MSELNYDVMRHYQIPLITNNFKLQNRPTKISPQIKKSANEKKMPPKFSLKMPLLTNAPNKSQNQQIPNQFRQSLDHPPDTPHLEPQSQKSEEHSKSTQNPRREYCNLIHIPRSITKSYAK